VQHADDGYSRRGYFGGLLVYSMVLVYSPNGTNVSGSRSGKFDSCPHPHYYRGVRHKV